MRAISPPSAPLRRPRFAIEDTPKEETCSIVKIDDSEESLSPPAPTPTSAEEASAAAAPGATGAIPRRETLPQRWEALRNALRHARDKSQRVLALERETIAAWDNFLASDPSVAAISTSWAKGVEKRRAELDAVDARRAAREERKKAAAEASQAQQELRAAQAEERRALAKIEAARAKARAAAQRESQSDLILAPAVNVVQAPAPAVAPAPAPIREQEHPVRRAGRQPSEKDCFVCGDPNLGRSSRCPISLITEEPSWAGRAQRRSRGMVLTFLFFFAVFFLPHVTTSFSSFFLFCKTFPYMCHPQRPH